MIVHTVGTLLALGKMGDKAFVHKSSW